jgi:3-oxoadipate enol-lactonase
VIYPVKTHYRIEGTNDGPVVTLSHPLGATLDLWDGQAAALEDRYRVLRYDVRGHGASDVPPGPYTLEQMAGDLYAVLQAEHIASTHFVGLSMGGLIGMTAALTWPRAIESLVLCDTTSCYGAAIRAMWDDRIHAAESQGMTDALIERTMEIWFTPAFRERHKATVDRVRAMLRGTDPRGYVGAVQAIADVDLTERLGAITCPTLVVVGERDAGTPPAMARAIHERIHGSRLLVLPDAAHCSVVERAAEFNRALLAFLTERR